MILLYIGYILIGIGVFFTLTAIVGFVKFKEPFKMMHVAGVCDLMGGPFIMLGCGVIFISHGDYSTFFKLLCLILIVYLISPISTNAISEVASYMQKLDFRSNIKK